MPRINSLNLLKGLSVTLICLLSSGCATRALMSSDRYEKPAESNYQNQSIKTHEIDISPQEYATYKAKTRLL